MKDFLLICDKNCATYKEVFPLFKQGIVSFGSPVKEYDGTDKKFGNHGWITTFPVHNKKKLILTATYDPALYPKYDNYDAIEVSRVKNIPYDYDGTMGVPITILDYDLDNVEIDRCLNDNTPDTRTPTIKGKEKYTRILIKKNFEIMEFGKKFLIIGNKNAITYKEIFPLIKDNKMWLGFTVPEDFEQPEGFEKKSLKGLTRWFTNLVHSKRLEGIYCPQRYAGREDKYPVYDNYDAIEIGHYTKNGKWEGSLDELPYDYDGVMGVPITFLDHYSPEQFEILGATQRGCHNELPDTRKYDNYREITQEGTFTGSGGGKTNENANVVGKPNKGNYFIDDNGRTIYSLYQRIFIRRKK